MRPRSEPVLSPLWSLVAALLLAGGCAHTPAAGPAGRTCLAKRGCPPPETLSPCPAGTSARPLAALLSGAAEAKDQDVTVVAPLRRGLTICTAMLCGRDNPCCNRCGATLFLSDEPLDDALAPGALALTRSGGVLGQRGELGCAGDDSRVCCPLSRYFEQPVVARGTLVHHADTAEGPRFALRDPVLCLPPPSPPKPKSSGEASGQAPVTVEVPTAFVLTPQPDGRLRLSWDTATMRRITVTPAGPVLGVRVETRLVAESSGEPGELLSAELRGGVTFGGSAAYLDLGPHREKGEPLRLRRTVVIFSTDVPPGHLWQPQRGAYRELTRFAVEQAVP